MPHARSAALLMAGTLLLTACSACSDGSGATDAEAAVTLQNCGETVRVDSPPKRAVSTAAPGRPRPSATSRPYAPPWSAPASPTAPTNAGTPSPAANASACRSPAPAQEPRELLLDEPTNHLDIHHQLDLLNLVAGLPVTTVVALHDLNLAAMYCDHVLVLHTGRVHAYGAPGDVLTEELIAEVYGVRAAVSRDGDGRRPHVRFLGTLA